MFDESPYEMIWIRGKLADHVEDHAVLFPDEAVLATSTGTESSHPRPPKSLPYAGVVRVFNLYFIRLSTIVAFIRISSLHAFQHRDGSNRCAIYSGDDTYRETPREHEQETPWRSLNYSICLVNGKAKANIYRGVT